MKIVAQTKDLIVIDLENDSKGIEIGVEVDGSIYFPRILRVYQDHMELDVKVETAKTAFLKEHAFISSHLRKKTLKEWFHDWIVMNRALFRINRPERFQSPLKDLEK
jgi:hypothetical protein